MTSKQKYIRKQEQQYLYNNIDTIFIIRQIKIYYLLKITNKNITLKECKLDRNELENIYFLNKYRKDDIRKWIKTVL